MEEDKYQQQRTNQPQQQQSLQVQQQRQQQPPKAEKGADRNQQASSIEILPDSQNQTQVPLNMDALIHALKFDSETVSKTDTINITTSCKFRDSITGHGIQGNKTLLVRVGEQCRNGINTLQDILTKYCLKDRTSKSLFICNSIRNGNMLLEVLTKLKKDPLLYAYSLIHRHPDKSVKRDVYDKWNGKHDTILVTDYRCCRGIENETVSTKCNSNGNLLLKLIMQNHFRFSDRANQYNHVYDLFLLFRSFY